MQKQFHLMWNFKENKDIHLAVRVCMCGLVDPGRLLNLAMKWVYRQSLNHFMRAGAGRPRTGIWVTSTIAFPCYINLTIYLKSAVKLSQLNTDDLGDVCAEKDKKYLRNMLACKGEKHLFVLPNLGLLFMISYFFIIYR